MAPFRSQPQSPSQAFDEDWHKRYDDDEEEEEDDRDSRARESGDRGREEEASYGPSPGRARHRNHDGGGRIIKTHDDTRRARACEACRCSKVRCEQPDPGRPCRRCAKARRVCVPSMPGKQQHRRHSSKPPINEQLMELGGKIDHLITALQQGEGAGDCGPAKTATATAILEEQARTGTGTVAGPHNLPPPCTMSGLATPSTYADVSVPDQHSASAIYSLTETGIAQIISMRTADAIIDRYRTELMPQFPAVPLRDATTTMPGPSKSGACASDVLVRLAILAAAASGGVCDPDTQERLRRLQNQVLDECVQHETNYSIELVQALIISAIWYTSTPSATGSGEGQGQVAVAVDLQQLGQTLADIAVKTGLDKKRSTKRFSDGSIFCTTRGRQDSSASPTAQLEDLEARRIWLACYYVCSNITMPWQQPSLLCWNQYMDECIQVLESSSLALPSDQQFCRQVRLQRATDERSRKLLVSHFFRRSPAYKLDAVEFLDSCFNPQLTTLDDSSLRDASDGITRILYHSSVLYLYEVAITIHREVESTGSKFLDSRGVVIPHQQGRLATTSPTISALLSEAIKPALEVISIFTSLDTRAIQAMPTMFLIRILHAITVLVHFSTSTERNGSYGSDTLEIDVGRIQMVLNEMIDIMTNSCSDWPAVKLAQVLIQLRKKLQQNSIKSGLESGLLCYDPSVTEKDRIAQSSASVCLEHSTSSPYRNRIQPRPDFELVDVSAERHGSLFDKPGFWEDLSIKASNQRKNSVWDSGNVEMTDAPNSQQSAAVWDGNFFSDNDDALGMGLFSQNNDFTDVDPIDGLNIDS